MTNEVLRASVRRGRNRILNKFEAGTATVEIRDDNGDFNPSNTAGPYYGKLVPLRKIRVFADYDGVRHYLFSGFITSYDTNFVRGVDGVDRVTLTCVDAFRLLQGANITTVPGATAGQLSGERVSDILDLVAFPAVARSIDAGITTKETQSISIAIPSLKKQTPRQRSTATRVSVSPSRASTLLLTTRYWSTTSQSRDRAASRRTSLISLRSTPTSSIQVFAATSWCSQTTKR